MYRPKDNGIIPIQVNRKEIQNLDNKNHSVEFRKVKKISTYDRIFSPNGPRINKIKKKRDKKNYKDSIGKILEEQGKISCKPVSGKINNDDFHILSLEAKKNFNERYYIEQS